MAMGMRDLKTTPPMKEILLMENTKDSANIGMQMAVSTKGNGATPLNTDMASTAKEMNSYTREIGNMENVMELGF